MSAGTSGSLGKLPKDLGVLIEEVADAGALTQAGLPLLGLSALSLALAAVPDPARVAKPAQMGWRPMS